MITIELDCLDQPTCRAVLAGAGIAPGQLDDLVEMTPGHPLSIWIAVDALERHLGLTPLPIVGSRLANNLAALHLDGLDVPTRDGVEVLGAVRRGPPRLLGALLPSTLRETLGLARNSFPSSNDDKRDPSGVAPHPNLRMGPRQLRPS